MNYIVRRRHIFINLTAPNPYHSPLFTCMHTQLANFISSFFLDILFGFAIDDRVFLSFSDALTFYHTMELAPT